uniref:asparaginase n=1 Tax=Globisporangium ultimum (strain ATCC 200006 / CBS 805.95 / DAOM BR144) TaxID=431595 RepID=K3WD84_GLOUD
MADASISGVEPVERASASTSISSSSSGSANAASSPVPITRNLSALALSGVGSGVDPVSVSFAKSPPQHASCGTPTNNVVTGGVGGPHERAHCLIIYTGGTFGMVPDAEGVLHPSSGFLEKKISEMDEFLFENMPKVTVSEWKDPIDSSDMSPADWGRIARQIESTYWDYDGFVVLQGTDTMAYTASALSFMLEYLGKPVVISGAMIPLHYPHSDARRNLIMSVMCAANLAIPEVCIYSNDKLLRGNRTTKIANMSVDAFHSPNFPSLASTGVETTVDQALILPYPRRRFSVFTDLATNICVFHLVPGFDDDCIEAYIQRHNETKVNKTHKAIVFALYGTGNAPLRKDGFLRLIQNAINASIPVTITTQCVQGRTQLDTYATGVKLLRMGVITSLDMTIEACVAKLAYLMGKGFHGAELKTKMETDLRGELSVMDSLTNGEDVSHTRQYRKTVIKNFVSH